jgi:starvation-inducible DNA-binding protein
MSVSESTARQEARTRSTSLIRAETRQDIGAALNVLLADIFALYVKTKSFHWHVSGPHFRDYHRLFDEQASQLFAAIDVVAERVRMIGDTAIRSIGHIGRLQRVVDNDAEHIVPVDMLAELHDDNLQLCLHMHEAYDMCEAQGDVATAGLLANWIGETEQRIWFLLESGHRENLPQC